MNIKKYILTSIFKSFLISCLLGLILFLVLDQIIVEPDYEPKRREFEGLQYAILLSLQLMNSIASFSAIFILKNKVQKNQMLKILVYFLPVILVQAYWIIFTEYELIIIALCALYIIPWAVFYFKYLNL